MEGYFFPNKGSLRPAILIYKNLKGPLALFT